jgi:hypothetical protein
MSKLPSTPSSEHESVPQPRPAALGGDRVPEQTHVPGAKDGSSLKGGTDSRLPQGTFRNTLRSTGRNTLARIDRGIFVLALVFLLTIPLLTPRVAASDEIEYFSYLHSIVFDHDLNFRNEYEHFCNLNIKDCIDSRFKETFLDDRTATGLQINFGPIGSALLWSPFYLVAHLAALIIHQVVPGLVADGYSAPYLIAISFASLLYGWVGLMLAYRIARDYVDEKIALGATLAVLLATNAVYYMYVAPAMSHAPSLFASALFVFVWYRTRNSRRQG